VVNDWETAYYTEFSAHGGNRPLVVSYNSSPPAEVIFAETPITEPPTAALPAEPPVLWHIKLVPRHSPPIQTHVDHLRAGKLYEWASVTELGLPEPPDPDERVQEAVRDDVDVSFHLLIMCW